MENFSHLRRSRLVLLTARGPGSVAVHHPVRLRLTPDDDDVGYVWIPRVSRLARRLDGCAHVRLAPCDLRWRPTGSDQPATAERDDAPPVSMILPSLLLTAALVCYRLRPSAEPTPWNQLVAAPVGDGQP